MSASTNTSLSWLITGGCGFIGRNLIRFLQAEANHCIRVLDNLAVGSRGDLARVCDVEEVSSSAPSRKPADSKAAASPVQLVVGDILDAQLVLEASRNIDVIVHLAANTGVAPSVEDPRADCETNVIGTLNCLEAARHNHVRRFVFASSGAPLGECEPPVHEELAPHPVSPYGAGKLAGEGYCSAYYRSFGLETVCLRFGNVYGPFSGKKDSVIAKFIKQALAGEPVEIYGDGTQTRDYIYAADLVRAIGLAATRPGIGGEVFQIATSREHTVNEVAELLKTELARQGEVNMTITYGQPRVGDVRRNYSDTTKAQHRLDWKTEMTLAPGIAGLVKWFLADGENNS